MRNISFALVAAFAVAGCTQPGAAPAPASDTATPSSAAKTTTPASAAPEGEACSDTCGNAHDTAAEGAAHACGGEEASAPAAAAPALERVPADQVCMRSNRFQKNRPQISTEVGGHTYFGCCAGCAKGLANDAAARTAKDPISGRTVDKATAVIGARPDGSVVYFENEETFARAGGA